MIASFVGTRASASIVNFKADLAQAVTDALYAANPDMLEKYGEPGRRKCLQDMHYNLEHLASAVGLDDPGLFGRYVEWLGDLLRARGIPTRDVHRSLETTEAVIVARLPIDEAAAVVACLRAGLAALPKTG